jgi:hypothetical protein
MKEDEMGKTYSTLGTDDKWVQDFSQKTCSMKVS